MHCAPRIGLFFASAPSSTLRPFSRPSLFFSVLYLRNYSKKTVSLSLSLSISFSFSFCLSFSLVFRHISVFDRLATSPSASASEFSFSLTIFLLFLPLSIVPFFSSSLILSSSFLLHSRHLTFEKNEYLEYCKKEIRRRLYAAATTSRSSSPISCSQADENLSGLVPLSSDLFFRISLSSIFLSIV